MFIISVGGRRKLVGFRARVVEEGGEWFYVLDILRRFFFLVKSLFVVISRLKFLRIMIDF